VELLKTGVVNVVDADCSKVPPVAALYQSIVLPAEGVAVSVKLALPQLLTAGALVMVGAANMVSVCKLLTNST
jgi:hypothetical protein